MLPEATLNDLWKFRGGITPMASMNTVTIGFDEETIAAIRELRDSAGYAVDNLAVQVLVSACHGLRIGHVATGRCALDGSWSKGAEMVEVSADSFRKMLDALKALDGADHA